MAMLDLFKAAQDLQIFFDKQRWKYCFIGGIAVQKWGQARFTKDIDLTILAGFGGEETFIDVLLGSFKSRIPDARKYAIQNRVLLLTTAVGIDVDISLGAFPFEESAVAHAKKVRVLKSIHLKLCTAEDLIVFKAFANRGLDWMDIEGVIAKQLKSNLDWTYIFNQLTPLAALKEEPEIVPKLVKLIEEIADE